MVLVSATEERYCITDMEFSLNSHNIEIDNVEGIQKQNDGEISIRKEKEISD